MKGALACYLEVVEVLQTVQSSLGGSLYVVGVADEEYKMFGAQEIGESGPQVDGGDRRRTDGTCGLSGL